MAWPTMRHRRTAFQAIFAYKLTLHELPASEVNGLAAALTNANAFAAEVAETINSLFAKVAV